VCTRTIDGKETTFGTTGYTRNNVFVLYDRNSGTLWHPLEDGRFDGVAGEKQGDQIPFRHAPDPITLEEWRAEHPDTLVLVPPPGESLLRGPPRGYLGVQIGTEGVLDQVMEDTAAARAGLLAGDRLVRIGDTDISSRGDVTSALRGRKPGEELQIVFVRDGKERTVEVELGERP
jgi:predicted metalloprotease with PDZ domain